MRAMAYTPELSYQGSCTLRRIAWALRMPMTEAIEKVFEEIVKHLDHEEVCLSCKDRTKCNWCHFNHKFEETEGKKEGVQDSLLGSG